MLCVDFLKIKETSTIAALFEGISIGFKYTGQPKSCLRCSSLDHVVAECPHKRAQKMSQIDDWAAKTVLIPEMTLETTAKTTNTTKTTKTTPQEKTPSPPAPKITDNTPKPNKDTEMQDLQAVRKLDSPTKHGSDTKVMTMDNFDSFMDDLRSRTDLTRLLVVQRDKVIQARAFQRARDGKRSKYNGIKTNLKSKGL